MKANLIRISLIALVSAIGSTGALAHESYSEGGSSLWVTQNSGETGNQAMQRTAMLVKVADYGEAVKRGDFGQLGTSPGRTLIMKATTRGINAMHLETVKIENDRGQSFVWFFDTYGSIAFPLKVIAPKAFDAGDTWVYVNHPYDHSGF